MSIYFDFDDVISNLYPCLKDLIQFIHGWNPPDSLNLYCFNEQEQFGGNLKHNIDEIPITDTDIHKLIAMLMYGDVRSLPVCEDVRYYFDSCNLDDELKIVTARTCHLESIMKKWFSINLPEQMFKIYFCNGSINKAKILHDLKADYYVEDQYKIANTIADSGIKVFLVNKSYNQGLPEHDNIIRINKLRDIQKYY